jgi:hypothetical protein
VEKVVKRQVAQFVTAWPRAGRRPLESLRSRQRIHPGMARPTLLVAEVEPGAALSVRKLVLETAKYNVITAHSVDEAVEEFGVAPKLYAALIVTGDLKNASALPVEVKKKRPEMPTIWVAPHHPGRKKGVDYHVPSHEPQKLVDLCRKLLGDPREGKK